MILKVSGWTAAAFVLTAFPLSLRRVEPGADSRVLSFVHGANLHEIAQAGLARDRSGSEPLKAFAVRVVSDHAKADGQIRDFAASQHIELQPAGSKGAETIPGKWTQSWESGLPPAGEAERVLATLSGLQGAAFDREFARVMVDDYRRMLELLSAARAGPISLELRIGIDRAIPALKDHLRMAEELQTTVVTR